MMMRTCLPVLAVSAALSPTLVAAQDLDLDSLVDAQETQAADPASQYGPGDDKEFSASTEDDITSLEKGDLYKNNSSLFKVISIASKGEQGGTFTMQRIGGTNDPSPSWARTSGSGPPSIITRESLWDLHLAVPLFPELEPYLRDAFEEAPDGAEFVLSRYRHLTSFRTQMTRLIRRAGLTPWPRVFHNLRASRQTELTDQFPEHVVCDWIGNTEGVARRHYEMVTDEQFAQAVQTNQSKSVKVDSEKIAE